ncbi:DUF72 domain-containing protein [Cytobacillus sp. IB215316]|uniref:DUF72 domain-containing protein n=1 Tax=Cytobacillus sp. IB215316 TaxID=3097354 RepID=UPI002A153B74|nr:DUF72 domain-containing protein [Cytobacillus sp. IB215316]MDX8360846.1 DUF72 domain-containing protein [Cytobacillus sp. IB215316]
MIYIGLTGWGDHDSLYPNKASSRDKLHHYSAHFPIVELDASFYAIQPLQNMEKWANETPNSFQFIVKAYQGMTRHLRGKVPFNNIEEMFNDFRESLKPLIERKKLAMVLFQFPPWFDCKKEHVDYLRYCRERMQEIPCALEFRHQSWFIDHYRHKTIQFMIQEGWIHSICDEPQAGEGSIPTILNTTNEQKTLVRFHGRNVHGWNKPNSSNWREIRYLYRYNDVELEQWIKNLHQLKKNSENIYVLFNNNSGGDAADNAKQLISMLEIQYNGLSSKQLDLF